MAANSETERPTLIIGHTVMGKGPALPTARTEDKVSTHGQPLMAAGADSRRHGENLGAILKPARPCSTRREAFAERREALRAWAAARQAGVEKTWRGEHGEDGLRLDMSSSPGHLPEIDYKSIEVKAGVATRAASATVLGVFAEKIENMIVAPADLSNSDKTDGFLKKTKAFTKGDQRQVLPGGRLGADDGLRHGQRYGAARGRDPICGTFFVFRPVHMKPAVRLSALMRLHVIYVWTRLVPRGRGWPDAPARRTWKPRYA